MNKDPRIIKLTPLFKEKIWGGRNLTHYFKDLPAGPIGECWVISGHPHGDTLVADGPFKGMPLSKVYNENRHLFGNDESESFPLLVKFIDAKYDLSIQVHPDDTYAHKIGEEYGKEEVWLILKAPLSQKIQLGHYAQTKEEFINLVKNNEWNKLLKYAYIEDNYLVPVFPGTLHAILGGTLLLEIQQASDLTYRLYDYDRLDDRGNKRPLHIKEALAVTNVPDTLIRPKSVLRDTFNRRDIFKGNHFTLGVQTVHGAFTYASIPRYYLLIVTSGQGEINNVPLTAGDAFILTTSQQPLTLKGFFNFVLVKRKEKK